MQHLHIIPRNICEFVKIGVWTAIHYLKAQIQLLLYFLHISLDLDKTAIEDFFYVLLIVHLSIILVTDQLNAQILVF